MVKILGIDPALNKTGWGVISTSNDGTMSYIASGIIKLQTNYSLPEKIALISSAIKEVLTNFNPDQIAIEETFVNTNPLTSLKLGHARGAIIASCSNFSAPIYEYGANKIKKTVCGVGKAEKQQVAMMVKVLLPKANFKYDDESDALAVAICHLNHHNRALLN